MKTLQISLMLGVGLFAACHQPTNTCQAARGTFAAKFFLKSGSGACATLKGDTLGIQTYSPSNGAPEPKPDLSQASVAIQLGTAGGLRKSAEAYSVADPDPTHNPYSLGAFASIEPSNEICSAPNFDPQARYVTTEAVPPVVCAGAGGGGGAGGGAAAGAGGAGGGSDCMEDPGLPKTDLQIDWSNFKLMVRPDVPGTQFQADMKLTRTENGESCEATYNVVGVYPSVDCGVYDDSGARTGIDPVLCDPNPDPDPEKGRPVGSGLNPDFPIVCDPDLALCVLASDTIPAIRK